MCQGSCEIRKRSRCDKTPLPPVTGSRRSEAAVTTRGRGSSAQQQDLLLWLAFCKLASSPKARVLLIKFLLKACLWLVDFRAFFFCFFVLMWEAIGSRDGETEQKQTAMVSFHDFLPRGKRSRDRLKEKDE